MIFHIGQRTRLTLVLCLLALVIGVVPTIAQDTPLPTAVGARPDAPSYALHGPYWVGTQEFVVEPDSDRPLDITVWYPALNPESLEESVVYNLKRVNLLVDITVPGTQLISIGHALAGAAPDPAGGPYPVVIWSHGYSAWRQGYSYLPEHLASWGFIVIAPEHLDEIPSGGIEMHYSNFFTRPLDIDRALAYAEANLNASGEMAGLIDLEHVAVSGHSFGGWTAVVEGGAQIDTQAWIEWCSATPGADEIEDCQMLPLLDDMAALRGLDTAPEGLWPPMNNLRVDAIVLNASGLTWQFGDAGLAAVQVPALAIFGDADTTVGDPMLGARGAYLGFSSPQKALVQFQNADHAIFIDKCSAMPWMSEMGLDFLCSDPVWDMDRAHDLINHFTTAFLLDVLKGDVEAHAALSPDAVSFPGIVYEAEGF